MIFKKGKIFRIVFIVSLISCSKSSQPKTTQPMVGNWTWTETYGSTGPVWNPANTGILKTVNFQANGSIMINHNDSSGPNEQFSLIVVQTSLLPNASQETGNYQTESRSAGCVPISFSALNIDTASAANERIYQYIISNDSLYITNPPCLAPITSVYLKSK